MLTGSWKRGIDAKNRVVIPAEIRSYFAAGGYVSDQGNHVGIFPAAAFDELVADIKKRVDAGLVDRRALRSVTSRSFEFSLDTAGRVLLPAYIRGLFPADGELELVGCDDYAGLFTSDDLVDHTLDRDAVAQMLDRRSLADALGG